MSFKFKLSVGTILKLAASLLAIVAFFMMFADQVKMGDGRLYIVFPFDEAVKEAGGIVVGYILSLVAGLVLAFSTLFEFNNKKVGLIILISGLVLLLVGTILMFCTGAIFKGAVDARINVKLATGAIVGGILGIVSLLCEGSAVLLQKFNVIK